MSGTSGGLGLDKLGFYLPASDVTFTPDFECSVEQPRINSATGEVGRSMELLRLTRRSSVSGSKAFLNTPDYQFTVKPDWETGTPLCLVQFSAGAFAETNLEPLDKDGAAEATLAVERDLKARGAALDLNSAKLVRLDIAENVALDEPVDSYAPLFASAGGKKRVNKQDFGGTGFLLGNTQWQLAAYDKGAQMKEKGYELQLRPVNTLRLESRLMRSRVIRDRLGLTASTLPELRENWTALRPAFDKTLRSQLFRHSSTVGRLCFLDFDVAAQMAFEGPKSREWARFKSMSALGGLIGQLGLAGAKNFADKWFTPENTASAIRQRRRYHAELDEVAFRLSLDGSAPSGRSLLTLYQELEKKLLLN